MNFSQIVMVPGLLSTGEVYRPTIDALGSDVFVAETRLDDTIEAMARRLLDEASGRFLLCGHSMGGYVALEVLRLATERVAGLALIATSARADMPEQTSVRRRLVAMAQERGIEAAAQMLEGKLFGPRTGSEALRRLNLAMAREIGAGVFARQQAAIIGRRDQRAMLETLAVPTVVLAGTADAIIPPQRSQEMAAAIPGAELVTLEGIGHMVPLEAPRETAAAVARLQARISADRRG
ncbi:alpha/beta fold hydrolase [Jiella avicenniae]|uniref:Alpha/beta hydrolase n=1 Tax=Jiella avicenniae TaxID=2907202 RepID=A0A9X1P022_9HYPH|nr:alpha/beta hydrolase [Jiella avicenniae]MCE7028028.1 alpha/beta hydrolase [Jiella avicenniae]